MSIILQCQGHLSCFNSAPPPPVTSSRSILITSLPVINCPFFLNIKYRGIHTGQCDENCTYSYGTDYCLLVDQQGKQSVLFCFPHFLTGFTYELSLIKIICTRIPFTGSAWRFSNKLLKISSQVTRTPLLESTFFFRKENKLTCKMVYSEVQALDKLAEQILVSKWAFKGEKFIRLSSLQDHRHSS